MDVLEPDSTTEQVEPVTTWREVLAARLRPVDYDIGAEEIFAILNDGETAAELCAARGITVPMYCVWKSKYRQLDLDQLREARRREERRRYAAHGLMLLAATVLVVAIGGGFAWMVFSTIRGLITASPAASTTAVEHRPSGAPAAEGPRLAPSQPSQRATATRSAPAEPAASVVETGYRIQVTAAPTDEEGRALVAQLTSKGYPAYLTRAVVGAKDVFRVRVGPFDTLSDAEQVAAELGSAGYAGVWIAR